MADKIDKASEDWIDKQDALMDEGKRIVADASNEALEYITDAIDNINDKQWRKMVVESQAVEMGIGIGIAEHLVPVIYQEMERKMHKRLKLPKSTAKALRHIYIGRLVKNVRRTLNERNQ